MLACSGGSPAIRGHRGQLWALRGEDSLWEASQMCTTNRSARKLLCVLYEESMCRFPQPPRLVFGNHQSDTVKGKRKALPSGIYRFTELMAYLWAPSCLRSGCRCWPGWLRNVGVSSLVNGVCSPVRPLSSGKSAVLISTLFSCSLTFARKCPEFT